jgi:geranylgeranyl diphosphate synthase type I
MDTDARSLFSRARDFVNPPMREAVSALSPHIRRVVEYHLGWTDADGSPADADSGKAVRPALTLAACAAVGADPAVALTGAVAVELVHNFSLLHDDVMDEDRERRHRATAWTVFGVGRAILAGDALLALAHTMLIDSSASGSLRAAEALSRATSAMIDGQAEDLDFESRSSVSVEECLAMSANKTAALMSCACAIGGALAGADETAEGALAEFGYHLGLSFQAVDDVLGIWGDPVVTGKPSWNDLRQRKKSLPVVATLSAGGGFAAELSELIAPGSSLDDDRVARAAELTDLGGGRRVAEELAAQHLAEALAVLERVNLHPQGRSELQEIARFVTSRGF